MKTFACVINKVKTKIKISFNLHDVIKTVGGSKVPDGQITLCRILAQPSLLSHDESCKISF